jgi:hypothetical protein
MGLNYPTKFFYGMLLPKNAIEDENNDEEDLEIWSNETQTEEERSIFRVEMEYGMGNLSDKPIQIQYKHFRFNLDGSNDYFREHFDIPFPTEEDIHIFESSVRKWAARNHVTLADKFGFCHTFQIT